MTTTVATGPASPAGRGFVVVGGELDVAVVAGGPQRDRQVVQRRSAGDVELAASRVQHRQLTGEVREALDTAVTDPKPPGLRVVHRRRPRRRRYRLLKDLLHTHHHTASSPDGAARHHLQYLGSTPHFTGRTGPGFCRT